MKTILLDAMLLFHSELHPETSRRVMATEPTYFSTHAECVVKARQEIAAFERREKATFVRVLDGFFCEVDPLKAEKDEGRQSGAM